MTLRALLVSVAIGFVSCAGIPLPREGLSDPGALLFNGYVRPDIDCYVCHNGDGRGARGPALLYKVPRLSPEKINRLIQSGSGMMPKYTGKLSDEELAQLVAWLKLTFR
jgi:mono/diheme cytochrome c family protein